MREEIRYAASLVKAGKMMVRGICWHPSLDATSIQFGQALVFPVRLHDSFLLEDLQLFRGMTYLYPHTIAVRAAQVSAPRILHSVEAEELSDTCGKSKNPPARCPTPSPRLRTLLVYSHFGRAWLPSGRTHR